MRICTALPSIARAHCLVNRSLRCIRMSTCAFIRHPAKACQAMWCLRHRDGLAWHPWACPPEEAARTFARTRTGRCTRSLPPPWKPVATRFVPSVPARSNTPLRRALRHVRATSAWDGARGNNVPRLRALVPTRNSPAPLQQLLLPRPQYCQQMERQRHGPAHG